jgi:DnaJ family protein C protein 28
MPDRSIEEVIRRAIQEGKFDDLPGKGKPLQLDQNPHADPEWCAAHHILKSGGFSLPWIESLRDIENNLQEARADLARTWAWYNAEHDQNLESNQRKLELNHAREKFREQIASINHDIRSYNLEVPHEKFQLQLINAEH